MEAILLVLNELLSYAFQFYEKLDIPGKC